MIPIQQRRNKNTSTPSRKISPGWVINGQMNCILRIIFNSYMIGQLNLSKKEKLMSIHNPVKRWQNKKEHQRNLVLMDPTETEALMKILNCSPKWKIANVKKARTYCAPRLICSTRICSCVIHWCIACSKNTTTEQQMIGASTQCMIGPMAKAIISNKFPTVCARSNLSLTESFTIGFWIKWPTKKDYVQNNVNLHVWT